MTLFISVQALFAMRRDIAGDAASALFMAFGRYQLILAGFALIFTVLYYGMRPSWRLLSAFIAFALACVPAIYLAMLLIPRMESLREKYLTHTPQFSHLHGISMSLFVLEALLVLIGGLFLCVYRDQNA